MPFNLASGDGHEFRLSRFLRHRGWEPTQESQGRWRRSWGRRVALVELACARHRDSCPMKKRDFKSFVQNGPFQYREGLGNGNLPASTNCLQPSWRIDRAAK